MGTDEQASISLRHSVEDEESTQHFAISLQLLRLLTAQSVRNYVPLLRQLSPANDKKKETCNKQNSRRSSHLIHSISQLIAPTLPPFSSGLKEYEKNKIKKKHIKKNRKPFCQRPVRPCDISNHWIVWLGRAVFLSVSCCMTLMH